VMVFFSTVDRAKRHQAIRMEANAEFSLAHRVLQQAIRSLVMANEGEGKDDELKTKIDEDLASAQGDRADLPDDGVSGARFILQPDITRRGRNGRAMQSLELVVSTPPVHAITLAADTERDNDQALRQMERMRDRQVNLFGEKTRRSGSDSFANAG